MRSSSSGRQAFCGHGQGVRVTALAGMTPSPRLSGLPDGHSTDAAAPFVGKESDVYYWMFLARAYGVAVAGDRGPRR